MTTANFSEISYAGNPNTDFIEVAVTAGTDVSGWTIQIYGPTGAYSYSQAWPAPSTTVAGKDVYVFGGGIASGNAIAIVDDTGTALQFISLYDPPITASNGPLVGQTPTYVGVTSTSGQSIQSDDRGTSYYAQSTPNEGTIPCFAPGTLIDTPGGLRAVETLKVGDLVMTLDHGPQRIRWIRSSDLALEDARKDAKPVQIKAGALGHNWPAADLIVSPQHRILVGGSGPLRQIFASEVFVPAKSLTSLPGIRPMNGKSWITWIHFACSRHEVVTANGCLSESLLLGPMVLNRLSATERQAVDDIFGPALTPDASLNGLPARECLTVGAVKRQLGKHLKEKELKLPKEIHKRDRDLAMERCEAETMHKAQWLVQQSSEKVVRFS